MARPPRTTAQHKAAGSYRKDRHGDRIDEQFVEGLPQKPEGLPPEAEAFWDDILATSPREVWTPSDATALELASRWYANWRAVQEKLDGCLPSQQFRLLTMAACASKQLASALARLGLSPADRAKIRAPRKPEKNHGNPLLMIQSMKAAPPKSA